MASQLLDYEYLSPEQLKGFEGYKYSSVDTNPLSIYIMHPFWNRVVQFCPVWVAPNVLTFVGFLLTVLASGLLAFYDFDFSASSDDSDSLPIPRWVFLTASVLIFVAYTLDGIDGKQARRTGTSGPLGELFDHGLDSWTAALIPVALYSVFGRSDHSVPPLRFYAVCWNVFLTFYLTHFEKYNTGVLFLPWGYDLSMLATTGVLGVTYFIGHDGWKLEIAGNISSGHVLEIVFYASSLIATAPVVVWNIVRSYKDGTGKMRELGECVRPLYPVLVYFGLTLYWALYSPSDVIVRHPRAFYLLTGAVFSNITCRLVVSQMSDTRCQAWNWFLFPSALGLVLVFAVRSARFETAMVYLLWVFFTSAHVHYGTCVVRQMCRHFDIRCFTIRHRSQL